eukprot:12007982-Ditylum_brightwellii.AAC.1
MNQSVTDAGYHTANLATTEDATTNESSISSVSQHEAAAQFAIANMYKQQMIAQCVAVNAQLQQQVENMNMQM